MNTTIKTDIPIAYDSKIISKIKEMIKEGLYKLKSFVKVKEQPKYEIYYELEHKFNEIALKLEKYEFLNNELNYFLSISDKILYIVQKNCKNTSFGHCDFALYLFDVFIELWESKSRLINNYCETELKRYETYQIHFKNIYGEIRHEFYNEIYESNGEFSEKELYEIHESLREEWNVLFH